MLKSVTIKNYKSIKELSLDLGRINVFIGENGCGKSNLLEALVMAAAAEAGKLDHEFLTSRGVRVTEASLMRSCFDEETQNDPIRIDINFLDNYSVTYDLKHDGHPYSKWIVESNDSLISEIAKATNTNPTISEKFDEFIHSSAELIKIQIKEQLKDKIKEEINTVAKAEFTEDQLNTLAATYDEYIDKTIHQKLKKSAYSVIHKTLASKKPELSSFDENIELLKEKFKSFLIFSPENSALRNFYKEGQIEPLGINGEGLLKLLKVIESTDKNGLATIEDMLNLLGWYEAITIPPILSQENDKISIKDKYLKTKEFDQRSANEGFLFILFYAALIVSRDTPKIFAIDNIDASLNPRLCTKLIEEMTKLAKKQDKQIFLTTHNPATLDGLDLNDDEQKLFVVSRSRNGDTRIKQVPKNKYNKEEIKLSEAMLRGYLGGLPKGF
ncbi:MAG: hypothetical protein RI964_1223 [Pseudomonadota bacterium]|jgi:predicted ATPase